MKATKADYMAHKAMIETSEAVALGDPWQAGTNVPDVLVTIPGLRHEPGAGEFAFSLEGVKHRNVDWSKVREGLGYEGDMPDDLIDDMAALIWRHDLIQILSDRIKPI